MRYFIFVLLLISIVYSQDKSFCFETDDINIVKKCFKIETGRAEALQQQINALTDIIRLINTNPAALNQLRKICEQNQDLHMIDFCNIIKG